jgi:small neutral amino acid transporter SnatA (MarC family)
VLSLMNPFVCGLIFERGESEGAAVLNLFGISLDVFSVAGGGVLMWMGFSMLRGTNAKSGGGGFVRSTVQSFMGLIVMAMGMQFGLKGLSTFIQGAGG